MKKIFVAGLMGFVAIVVLILIFTSISKQSYGHISVQTNDSAAKISLIPKPPSKEFLIGVGKLVHATVGAGQYTIQAIDQNRISQMELNVPTKGNISVFLSINPTDHLNEITNFSAQDLSVSGSDIEFLNTALQQIYDYNFSTNAEHTIASDLFPVTKVLWINHQLAIAFDDIGNPHLLNGQSDSVLPIITTSTNDPAIQDFAVNSGGDFAYAQGGNVYLSKGGKTANLGQNNSAEVQVRLANDDAVFVNGINPTNPKVTIIDVGVPTKSTAYFITTAGQIISYPGSTTINEAAWSTDSQTIALSSNNGLTTYNYRTNKSTVVTLQGINPNSSFNWIDADHLLYVNNGVIWSYDLSRNASYKLVSAPDTINHEIPFAVSDDASIYFGTDSHNALGTSAAIYRLNP